MTETLTNLSPNVVQDRDLLLLPSLKFFKFSCSYWKKRASFFAVICLEWLWNTKRFIWPMFFYSPWNFLSEIMCVSRQGQGLEKKRGEEKEREESRVREGTFDQIPKEELGCWLSSTMQPIIDCSWLTLSGASQLQNHIHLPEEWHILSTGSAHLGGPSWLRCESLCLSVSVIQTFLR